MKIFQAIKRDCSIEFEPETNIIRNDICRHDFCNHISIENSNLIEWEFEKSFLKRNNRRHHITGENSRLKNLECLDCHAYDIKKSSCWNPTLATRKGYKNLVTKCEKSFQRAIFNLIYKLHYYSIFEHELTFRKIKLHKVENNFIEYGQS